MRKTLVLLAMVVVSSMPLTAQIPARPAPKARAAAAAPADTQDKFAAIRNRYQKEIDAARAALQRTRDRMREELTAAGWRGSVARRGMLRARLANFRRPMRRPGLMGGAAMRGRGGRGMMGPGAAMPGGRGAGMMGRGGMLGGRGAGMLAPGGRGAGMMGPGGRGAGMMGPGGGRAGMMGPGGRGAGMMGGRGMMMPRDSQMMHDSMPAIRRGPPPAKVRPDSGG